MYVLVRLNFTPLGFETVEEMLKISTSMKLNFTPLGFETDL